MNPKETNAAIADISNLIRRLDSQIEDVTDISDIDEFNTKISELKIKLSQTEKNAKTLFGKEGETRVSDLKSRFQDLQDKVTDKKNELESLAEESQSPKNNTRHKRNLSITSSNLQSTTKQTSTPSGSTPYSNESAGSKSFLSRSASFSKNDKEEDKSKTATPKKKF